MNRTNYHSHCDFCDGKAPMEEYIKAAIGAGFSAYGVSSHAPLPFVMNYTMRREDVPAYLEEVKRLRDLYREHLEVYAGMEIDYLKGQISPADAYFQELPLDYRIGSVHLLYTDDGNIIDTDTSGEKFAFLLRHHFKGDLRYMVGAYFRAMMDMVDAGGFDFVGHADKICLNAERCEAGVGGKVWYRKLRNDCSDFVYAKGIALEINTKGWDKYHCFFPDEHCWKDILERGISLVVNSDVHVPALVNAGREEALGRLKEAGCRTVRELHGGVWQEVPIG